jgi:hypothetical protein
VEPRLGTATGSVWVEFVGLPGAGKSEVSRAAARLLRSRNLPVSEPSYEMDHATPPAERLLSKLWLAARGWARSPRESRFWMQTLVEAQNDGPRWLRTVAVNWFYLIGSLQRWSAVPGIHVSDQGLLQALWSIGYAARRPDVISTRLLPRLGSALPRRTLVVLVDAGVPTILKRLEQRHAGRSRLERDLATERSAKCLARATQVLRYVEDVAWQLAEVHDVTVLRINNDTERPLPAHAETIADAVSELLSGPRRLHVSRWVPA